MSGRYISPWKIRREESEDGAANQVPKKTDILIIGGGVVGSSVAYWIKQQNPAATSITVVERDPVVRVTTDAFIDLINLISNVICERKTCASKTFA